MEVETNEAAEVTNEAIETANEEATQEQVQQPEKTEGWNRIDFNTASPEQIEKRFNRLYAQVKSLESYRGIAAEQASVIEDLRNGQMHIVNHLTETSLKDTEAKINAELTKAYETGDAAAIATATNKLVEIKTQQRLNAEQNKQQANKPAKAPQQYSQDINEIGREAVAEGELTQQDAASLSAWAAEPDDRGQPLRPWVNNSTGDINNPDPDYVKAWVVANQIFSNPAMEHLSFNQKLAEIDKRMGTDKAPGGQTVMRGQLRTPSKPANIKLNPEVEQIAAKIAVKTGFGGGKFKTDAERIAAYKTQIASSKRK